MAERWQYAVCDENGETHPMPERMARAVVAAGRVGEEEWTVWRRRVQVGEWHRADGGEGR